MRLLITGACGFVGSTIVRELRCWRPDISICGLDNFIREGSRTNRAPLEALGAQIVEGDIRNPDDLRGTAPVDWVIDCAAEPSALADAGGTRASFDLMDHNLVGSIRVLEFCKETRAGLILLSTSRVYSLEPLASLPVRSVAGAYRPERCRPEIGLTEAGIAERFPTTPPVSLYGISKRCSEFLALEYAEDYGLPLWINRCGVMAGKGEYGKADQSIFAFWIRSWQRGEPLSYTGFDGHGAQVCDCLHPRDLVPVILAQLSGRVPNDPNDGVDRRICNFAGGIGNAISLAHLSAWCTEHLGPRTVGSVMHSRQYDLPWVVLDCARAAALWDWRPITPLPDILAEIAAG